MTRKKLDEIEHSFSDPEPKLAPSFKEQQTKQIKKDLQTTSGSLTDELRLPKTKQDRIRFTLDLDKTLDDRLNKAADKLNRSKAEITRIALERLLSDLETEWK